MFTARSIRDRVRQQPFRPFRLLTSAGEAFNVLHPDLVMIGRRELVIGIPKAKDADYFDRVARVALLHVAAIEDLPRKRNEKTEKSPGRLKAGDNE